MGAEQLGTVIIQGLSLFRDFSYEDAIKMRTH